MLYGYARVSTQEQNLELQIEALKAGGVPERNIKQEKISGAVRYRERPVLSRLLRRLQSGDTLMVWKLDRLGRSAVDLLNLNETLKKKQVCLRSITENLDTDIPGGVMAFTVVAAVAEMERAYARERVKAGMSAAQAKGKPCGRREKLSKRQETWLVKAYQRGVSIPELSVKYNVAKATIRRYLTKNGICLPGRKNGDNT